MQHSANIHSPNTSPMWCNLNVLSTTSTMNNYDGSGWYFYRPRHHWVIWYTRPMVEIELDGNICYQLDGNVFLCPLPQVWDQTPGNVFLPPPESNIFPPAPQPTISVTSVKMENHAEHVAVMFGQVISNLK